MAGQGRLASDPGRGPGELRFVPWPAAPRLSNRDTIANALLWLGGVACRPALPAQLKLGRMGTGTRSMIVTVIVGLAGLALPCIIVAVIW